MFLPQAIDYTNLLNSYCATGLNCKVNQKMQINLNIAMHLQCKNTQTHNSNQFYNIEGSELDLQVFRVQYHA